MYKATSALCLIAAFSAASPATAGLRNPCNDPSAICEIRNGIKVCGYPGDTTRKCSSSSPSRPTGGSTTPGTHPGDAYRSCLGDMIREQVRNPDKNSQPPSGIQLAQNIHKECKGLLE